MLHFADQRYLKMICFPNAKINLGLHVINKRADGFHNIESVFYPVPLCDILEAVPLHVDSAASAYRFASAGLPVSGVLSDNLIIKAFQLIKANYNLLPTDIYLYKKIPMGAGLGGGSADAAFMLNLLNQKYGLDISMQDLHRYAAQLGSDCAFFLQNKPAYLYGKGHELEPCTISLKGWYLVLLYPQVHSNTAIAYQDVNRREILDEDNCLKNLLQLPVEQWKDRVCNDFELSVFRKFPQLSYLKQLMYDSGAIFALMSGSGSSLFGLFRAKPELPQSLTELIICEGYLEI